jgi:hypothetical protein
MAEIQHFIPLAAGRFRCHVEFRSGEPAEPSTDWYAVVALAMIPDRTAHPADALFEPVILNDDTGHFALVSDLPVSSWKVVDHGPPATHS